MMTLGIPESIQKYLIICTCAMVLMGFPEYLRINGIPIPPFIWALALLAVSGVVTAAQTGRDTWLSTCKTVVPAPIFWWWAVFLIAGLVAIIAHGSHPFAIEDIMRRISAAGTMLLLLTFMVASAKLRTWMQTGILWGGILLATSILLGYWRIMFVGPIDCRPGGFLVNPNTASYALCLCIIATTSCLHNKRLSVVINAFLLLAIFLTFSRSGLLAAAVTVIALGLRNWREILLSLGLAAVVLAAFVTVSLLDISHPRTTTCLQEVVSDRVNFGTSALDPSGSAALAPPMLDQPGWREDQSLMDRLNANPSTRERLEFAREAYNRFTASPLLGDGIDRELGNQTHNEFLSFTSQHGILGVLLFVTFWLTLYKSGISFSVLVPLFVISMFSHTFFYERFTLIVLGFLLACAMTNSNTGQRRAFGKSTCMD